jgi:hypothetical protein
VIGDGNQADCDDGDVANDGRGGGGVGGPVVTKVGGDAHQGKT